MDENTMVSVLVALFELARANRPANVERVAGRVGITVEEARHALRGLEARGLADVMRVRLTLLGLALAASAAERRELAVATAA